jgi:hypothetical protein
MGRNTGKGSREESREKETLDTLSLLDTLDTLLDTGHPLIYRFILAHFMSSPLVI